MLGSALLPVSAKGLGPPRPYAAYAAGPGGIALLRDLQSCLTQNQNKTNKNLLIFKKTSRVRHLIDDCRLSIED
jgi:hypothetical protein